MTDFIYEIVEHDGGWAYKANGTFSETFKTQEEAEQAAQHAADEQEQPGETSDIQYEDEDGETKTETVPGDDRPDTSVKSE